MKKIVFVFLFLFPVGGLHAMYPKGTVIADGTGFIVEALGKIDVAGICERLTHELSGEVQGITHLNLACPTEFFDEYKKKYEVRSQKSLHKLKMAEQKLFNEIKKKVLAMKCLGSGVHSHSEYDLHRMSKSSDDVINIKLSTKKEYVEHLLNFWVPRLKKQKIIDYRAKPLIVPLEQLCHSFLKQEKICRKKIPSIDLGVIDLTVFFDIGVLRFLPKLRELDICGWPLECDATFVSNIDWDGDFYESEYVKKLGLIRTGNIFCEAVDLFLLFGEVIRHNTLEAWIPGISLKTMGMITLHKILEFAPKSLKKVRITAGSLWSPIERLLADYFFAQKGIKLVIE